MSKAERRPREPGFAQGAVLLAGSVLSITALLILAPALPALLVAFRDVPDASFWVPTLISLPGLGAAVFSPFAGQVGDRFGRLMPLIGFCILFAVAGSLPLFTTDFTVVIMSRIFVGMAGAGALVLSTALIGDYFSGEARDRWLAGQAMLATCSVLALMPLGGVLTASLGWRGPFLAFLGALPLAIAYWLLCHEPKALPGTARVRSGWADLPWRWLSRMCLLSVYAAVLFSILQLQIGIALKSVGVGDAARIGGLSAIAATGFPLGALLFVKAVRMPFARLISLEFLGVGITLVLLGYASDYRVFLGIAFLNLVACGMILPTMITHTTRHLEPCVRARGIGVWQAAVSAGQFLSVGVTGLIMRYPGASVLDAFWLIGISAIVVAIASLTLAARRGATPGHVAV